MHPTWSEATGWQRLQIVFAVIISIILTVGIFFGAVFVLSNGADNLVRYHNETESCRKNAATPRDYHECR